MLQRVLLSPHKQTQAASLPFIEGYAREVLQVILVIVSGVVHLLHVSWGSDKLRWGTWRRSRWRLQGTSVGWRGPSW